MTRIETAPARAGGTRDAVRILAARGLRAFGDGCVSLLVPIYLLQLGFSALEIGAIVTSTLIGTALVTLWAGMVANRYSVRRLLLVDGPGHGHNPPVARRFTLDDCAGAMVLYEQHGVEHTSSLAKTGADAPDSHIVQKLEFLKR